MGDVHGFHGANGCAKCVEAGWTPPMTDLPDAETAWPTWYHENIERLWELEGRERDEALFTAGFAAASGPWAEQLDAANAKISALEADNKTWQATCEGIIRDKNAALARNAELQKQVEFDVKIRLDVEKVLDLALGTEPVDGAGNGLASDVHLLAMRWTEALDRADALRAELDNLRGSLTALAERKSHCSRDECHRLRTDLRAIVRGSDDEGHYADCRMTKVGDYCTCARRNNDR